MSECEKKSEKEAAPSAPESQLLLFKNVREFSDLYWKARKVYEKFDKMKEEEILAIDNKTYMMNMIELQEMSNLCDDFIDTLNNRVSALLDRMEHQNLDDVEVVESTMAKEIAIEQQFNTVKSYCKNTIEILSRYFYQKFPNDKD